MARIFLSYPRALRHLAEQLDAELRNRNVDVWYDAKLRPGDKLTAALMKALEASDCVVLLWNAEAAGSAWVQYELNFTAGKGKQRIVVRLDDSPIPSTADLYNIVRSPTNSMAEVASLISAILPQTNAINQRLPADPPKNRGFAFLSYAEEDFAFVQELSDYLRTEGFLFWEYNTGDRDVEKLLYLELEAKLNDSAIVLCIVSPQWKSALWPAREYFYAKEVGRPVFILECQELGPNLAIAGEHRFRCWGDRRTEGLQLLSRELKRRGL